MDWWREAECKRVHDPFFYDHRKDSSGNSCDVLMKSLVIAAKAEKCVWIPGSIVIGGGPSGLAVAACLKAKGIPSVVLERSNCIASLWQLKTYDRLHLHLPKHFCELPLMPFPSSFPTYPTKQQFVAYLEAYAREFDIRPRFSETVTSAEYDGALGFWRVKAVAMGGKEDKREYLCRWLVVATGENAEAVWPDFDGAEDFKGPILHTSLYKSGDAFRDKRVLVVGCGNSGMEVCLDLCNNTAHPSIVVRDSVHILPREMLGRSTFGLSMWLLKWLPVRMVDRLLLLLARLMLGDTARFGLPRPQVGPLELKSLSGKTPVLDVGTLARIKSGDIKVRPGVKKLLEHGAEFVDGGADRFDAVILATGYKSNVPLWLKEKELFSENDGLPRRPFPDGWKGERGLYAVGFTKRGLLGASLDARRIAQDIEQCWKAELKKIMIFACP
ncbi:unnamed protein product [Musa acuminata subsp. malaccensis]|uniref:Flavin-containing monooxygenase n=1 Tax=Musa acuminata subsp. malaccensis TaxID=214687 RepID=A0A804I5F0_MUSAM|nr:PREDICTED: indole-3-pyruvate monooxygenase YUCCA2-like [Musa acuminata subsp. malaccensis]CAG1862760.1 unnamed protein product [Musa acuminata subsp. malaccensis]